MGEREREMKRETKRETEKKKRAKIQETPRRKTMKSPPEQNAKKSSLLDP